MKKLTAWNIVILNSNQVSPTNHKLQWWNRIETDHEHDRQQILLDLKLIVADIRRCRSDSLDQPNEIACSEQSLLRRNSHFQCFFSEMGIRGFEN
jgi:hypothetical protein